MSVSLLKPVSVLVQLLAEEEHAKWLLEIGFEHTLPLRELP